MCGASGEPGQELVGGSGRACDGRLVEVEAHIGAGLPRTVLVGLPDASLYEARDRCKAAVANSGDQLAVVVC